MVLILHICVIYSEVKQASLTAPANRKFGITCGNNSISTKSVLMKPRVINLLTSDNYHIGSLGMAIGVDSEVEQLKRSIFSPSKLRILFLVVC